MKSHDADNTVTIRKWGNSLGIVLPKEMAKMQKLKAGERVSIELFRTFKKEDFDALFGSMPGLTKGTTTQKIKNELRKGWA